MIQLFGPFRFEGIKTPEIMMTGVMDLTIGLIYLVGLPRYPQVWVYDLLLDRG